MLPGTIRELFTYNDWARERLVEAISSCNDEALDRPFEMGEGTLRKTVHHLWGAEVVWLARWMGTRSPLESDEAETGEGVTIADLAGRFLDMAAQREAWLQTQDAETLAGTFTYSRPFWMEEGPDLELPLGVSVLHLLDHFPHHAAQAVNMLKQVGAKLPTVDYILMRRDGTTPTPPIDSSTLRRYLAHGDWAYRQVHEAGAALSEEATSREFPIGPGTLRRIMGHLADAPDWWMDNLDHGPGQPFPTIDESSSWDELWIRYERAARRRNSHLENLADLERVVTVAPRPGIELRFPLGVAMLQLCVHGTRHRAQALNMLRHTGGAVPGLDVNTWHRAGAPLVLGSEPDLLAIP